MRNDFLVFGSPYIDDEMLNEVVDCVKSGWWSTGPRVSKFEDGLKSYIGLDHCIALNSCTAGLHLSLLTAGIGPGDEVITTPITFAATANVIELVGATTVFADVGEDGNIDPTEIATRITSRTKAIIPVHLAGRMCDMDAILELSNKHNLAVIEDCAHALGSYLHGKHAGTFGTYAAFSFYVTKNLATGDGGAIVTNDSIAAAKLRALAHSGISRTAWDRFSKSGVSQYNAMMPGFKYGMMDIQAALGLPQLMKFNRLQERRQQLWDLYCKLFDNTSIKVPIQPLDDSVHAMHLFQVVLPDGIDRDTIQVAMKKANIGTGVHYRPLHMEPYYKLKYGLSDGALPNAERFGKCTLSLPLSPKLSDNDVTEVATTLIDIVRQYGRRNLPSV